MAGILADLRDVDRRIATIDNGRLSSTSLRLLAVP
jgi:hypothetical protein